MALSTVLVLGLLVSTISTITCRLESLANEIANAADEDDNAILSSENDAPTGNLAPSSSIKEISFSGKIIVKKFTCPASQGRYPHPESCEYYYECSFGMPTLWHCNRGYLYDKESKKCRERENVRCHDGHENDHVHYKDGYDHIHDKDCDDRVTGGKFYCPFPDGRYPNPEDCSSFYECRSSIPQLYRCPESTLYDEGKRQCVDKKTVKCNGRPGDNGDEIRDDKNGYFRCPFAWGTFAHPVDCSKYIVCINDVPSIFKCKKSELFDARYRRCLPKEKVTCNDRINPDDPYPSRKTVAPPVISTLRPVITPSTVKKTPEPASSTTRQVLKSTTAKPSTLSPVTKPNTPPPTDCAEDDLDCIIDGTGDVSGWFGCPTRFGYYPHGSSRQLFIHCDNWRPYVKRCADYTDFSPVHLVCVWGKKKPNAS